MYGQLGHGNTADAYAPTPIQHFKKAGAMARKVCCGEVPAYLPTYLPTHTHTHTHTHKHTHTHTHTHTYTHTHTHT